MQVCTIPIREILHDDGVVDDGRHTAPYLAQLLVEPVGRVRTLHGGRHLSGDFDGCLQLRNAPKLIRPDVAQKGELPLSREGIQGTGIAASAVDYLDTDIKRGMRAGKFASQVQRRGGLSPTLFLYPGVKSVPAEIEPGARSEFGQREREAVSPADFQEATEQCA